VTEAEWVEGVACREMRVDIRVACYGDVSVTFGLGENPPLVMVLGITETSP